MKRHYLPSELINPIDPIKICVIGVGGTGSHSLQGLGRMNQAFKMLGHVGLEVIAFDSDDISVSNVGRQMFHSSDVGENKATTIITKMNRYYGTNWSGVPIEFDMNWNHFLKKCSFFMVCVDNIKARKSIISQIRRDKDLGDAYIFDFGNGSDFGQIFISTVSKIKQPKSEYQTIDHIAYPKEIIFKAKEDKNEPSCSLWEALQKQDLFINPLIAELGLSMLWKMLRQCYLEERGIYLNLKNYKTNPIKL